MLADMTGATDERLRALALRLAGRLVIDLARGGPPRSRGVGRMRSQSAEIASGDLDLDRSMEALVEARATGGAPPLADLVVHAWSRPDAALALVIDKSGSMGGDRLASAALAAAAAAWRGPVDHSVLAFADRVIVIKAQDVQRHADEVVNDVFSLRGHGTTNLDLALRQAHAQLERSRARRRLTILLSDCEPTAGTDPLPAARGLEELAIIAPVDAADGAQAFATASGARLVLLEGPSDIPSAFATLLDR